MIDVIKDIWAIIPDPDAVQILLNQLYDVMRKHGIKSQIRLHPDSVFLVATNEWSAYQDIFLHQLTGKISVALTLDDVPEDIKGVSE